MARPDTLTAMHASCQAVAAPNIKRFPTGGLEQRILRIDQTRIYGRVMGAASRVPAFVTYVSSDTARTPR